MEKLTHPTIDDLPELHADEAVFVIEYCKDLNPRRAASVAGVDPDTAYDVLGRDQVTAAVRRTLQRVLKPQDITAEWVLQELYFNHMLARQSGNIAASNASLNLMAKHATIDAYAAERVKISTDTDTIERLQRERKRNLQRLYREKAASIDFNNNHREH